MEESSFYFFSFANTDIINKVSLICQFSVCQFPGKFHGLYLLF